MAWIFQAVPKRYDLRTELKANETEKWLVTRYGRQMRRGDAVYFWLAGKKSIRGIYGWGHLVGSETEYRPDWGDGIDVKCEQVFPEHISAEDVQAGAQMSQHLLFRMAVGTNFELTDAQNRELKSLIVGRFGQAVAPK